MSGDGLDGSDLLIGALRVGQREIEARPLLPLFGHDFVELADGRAALIREPALLGAELTERR